MRHSGNLPVRLIALWLAFTLAVPVPALAAENLSGSSTPELPAGLSPEQAEVVRKLLQDNAEARKALEEGQRPKAPAAPAGKGAPEAAGLDASKPEPVARPDATAIAAQAERAAAARYDWKKSPYVGNLFARRLTDNEAVSLPLFGHELFVPVPGAAQTLENVPVSAGYLVGPGDEIVVRMWGRVEGTQRMVVDRDGKIFFPKFGSLYVAGKTFDELRAFLKAKVSTIAEVSSDVTMGRLKGIRVSVVGEVRSPGWYNVSSLHTALQVLSIANGMKDIGSMRSVKINRGGRTVEEIDLYDFLLKGERRGDLRMLQDDVIFVPVVGRLVAIVGEVRRPAIYELRNEKTLLELVSLAGGFAPAAWKRRVQVERLEGNTARIVLDADADELEQGRKGFDLADGDVVRVFPIVLADENVVTLEGNVRRPGKYELKPGMTVGAILRDEKDFLPETYFDYALLVRRVPPDLHREIVPVNLREIVLERKPGADVALSPRDTLQVFPRRAFRDLPKAYISGEIRMTRKELLKPAAVDNQAASGRMMPEPRFLEPGGAELRGIDYRGPELKGGAEPRGTDPRAADPRSTDSRGPETRGPEFRGSGPRRAESREADSGGPDTRGADFRRDQDVLVFEIHAGTRVADLVKMAGGVTRLAYLERAEIVRVDDQRNFRTVYFHLGKAVAGDPKENLLLENEDQVRIHSIWETRYRKTVTVSGEVNLPGDYVLTEGMKLSDLLFKAGGYREGAFAREAELVRREVTPQGDLVKTQTIVVSPEKAIAGNAEADLPLREYDYLYVRQIPDWTEKIQVTMSGEFRFPGLYAVKKGERLSSVIERAGGFTPGAYRKAAVFTRVSTQKTQQEAIDRLIEELEMAIAQKGQEVGAALDREDVESNRQLMEARRSLVAQLRKAKAKGRVIIWLSDPEAMKGSGEDIFLEDGDQLYVPQKMNVVNVVGRVYNPTGVVYDPANDTVGYYLKTVGGPAQSADTDHIFLLKANGSVVSRDNAPGGFLSGGFMSAKVDPGDSVIVPEKLIQVRLMKDVKDITQILFQIAVTTGVLIALF